MLKLFSSQLIVAFGLSQAQAQNSSDFTNVTVNLNWDDQTFHYYGSIGFGDRLNSKSNIGYDSLNYGYTLVPATNCTNCDPEGWLLLSSPGIDTLDETPFSCVI